MTEYYLPETTAYRGCYHVIKIEAKFVRGTAINAPTLVPGSVLGCNIRNQAGMLTDAEREQLAILQQQADLVMLRKARAAVMLRFRGKRVPTLAELSQLVAMDK